MKKELTVERLKELLHYNPETGIFTWRAKAGCKGAGSVAGSPHRGGYRRQIMIDRTSYREHRLAWIYMTGSLPEFEIDHINTDGRDNRWENLRKSDRFANSQNQRRAHRNNKRTGLLGAYPAGKKFKASIRANGDDIYLGVFDTAIMAHEAYVSAKRQHHQGCTL